MDFVGDVARRFRPDDVVIFEQPQSIHLLSLPLWAVHGVNALELARFNPDPDAAPAPGAGLARAATATSTSCTPTAPTCAASSWSGWRPSPSAPTSGSAPTTGRPGGPEFRALHFTLSRVVPPEDLQVPPLPRGGRGRLRRRPGLGLLRQGGRGRRAPTAGAGACGSVYLPGRAGGRDLAVTASAPASGRRPPAEVQVSLLGRAAGRLPRRARLERAPAARCPTRCRPGRRVLRLDVPAWRPGERAARLGRRARPRRHGGPRDRRIWGAC